MLLRHAKSLWDDPQLPDHARPLNPRGMQSAAAMRGAIAGLGFAPDLVLVSSARRTLQTLEMLQPWPAAPPVQTMDALYLASAAQLLDMLHAVPADTACVMLIGHNPGLHDLALQLVGPTGLSRQDVVTQRLCEGFPTGALAAFTLAADWAKVGPGGGRLDHFFGPRDLPEPAA